MTDLQPGSVLMMLVALLLSVGNLIVAYGQSRARKATADAQGIELALKLAEKTPELEQQLRKTITQLHEARAQVAINQRIITDLKDTVQEQKEELERLKKTGTSVKQEVDELKSSVQTLQINNGH